MSQGTTLSQLAAQRKLGFLETIDRKLQSLRREAERLRRVAEDPDAPGARRSLSEIDRIARGLVGAGPVYGVEPITTWAKEFLKRVEGMRRNKGAVSEEDLDGLADQIQALEQLREEAMEKAQQNLANGDTPSIPKKSSVPPPVPEAIGKIGLKKQLVIDRESGAPAKATSQQEEPADVDNGATRISEPPTTEETGTGLTMTAFVVAVTKAVRKKAAFALTNAGFDVSEISSPSSVEELIQEESPDLVVVDMDDPPPGGKAIAEALSRDPLTDFLPLIRLTSAKNNLPPNAVIKPIDTTLLVAEARRLTGHDLEIAGAATGLGELTLEDLTDFVSAEIRAGVLEAATGSHVREHFSVLEKGSLVASVWALVARLRRVAAEGSEGKIRFLPTTHGPIGMMALDEAEQVLDPASHEMVDEADISALSGLSAVVADDDSEIRTVFEKVLTKAGMKVRTAVNGAQALIEIRKDPPDVVITDILMPEMDGWELTTRLKWNYSLKHIPVIMLSWKEDFLQRVRELRAEADDFMLKEVDLQQILTRVAGVLKPRFAIEQRLADQGVVTGRVERMGVITILKSVMGLRPDCRVTLRENWNYFEADVLEGELVAVNRTGTDGSFASGMPALERLLGVSSGRFSVIPKVEKPKRHFADGTLKAVREATGRLNNLNSQVVDGTLMNIQKVEMNDDVVAVYSEVVPPKLKTLVQRLAAGEIPRDIALDASASSETLEMLMLDLIHMGAIQGIISAPARKSQSPDFPELDALPGLEIKQPPPQMPKMPPPPPRINSGAPRDSSGTMPLSLDDISEIPPSPIGEPVAPLAQAAPASGGVSRIWQILAAVFLVSFIIAIVLLLGQEQEEPKIVYREAPAAPSPTPKEPEAKVALAAAEVMAADTSTLAPAEPEKDVEQKPEEKTDEEPDTEAPAPAAKETAPSTKVDKYGETSEQRAKRKARQKKREEEKLADRKQKEPVTKKTDKKTAAAPKPGTTGVLQVTAPSGASGPVKVIVDGRARGKAPVSVNLTSGLHEVVFESQGKRTMRMVSIKVGKTKTVQAKVPQ